VPKSGIVYFPYLIGIQFYKMKLIFILSISLLIWPFPSFGQTTNSCNIKCEGHVFDSETKEALGGATVFIMETKTGVVTDNKGYFAFHNLCAGNYTFVCEYIGYVKIQDTVIIDKSDDLNFELKVSSHEIKEVVVQGGRKREEGLNAIATSTISGAELEKTRGQSLGESLKDITGLNSIQTGPGISKPVIHGLHSNRILILNNGVRQEGQQWGQDHAPEIDPFTASEISVIKGPASLRYGSDAIGGVILLDPKKLPDSLGIHANLSLVGATNNRMGATSGVVEGAFGKSLTGLSWRIQGTLRRAGNSRAPNYYLDNTGFSETDFSSALAYTKENYGVDLYYSEYSTKIGVLTASHISNANDLYLAISSSEPIEKSVFSYIIDKPYQSVYHQLFKANGYLNFASFGKIEVTYASQIDLRKEYSQDISYNDSIARLNLPELSFKIISNTVDLSWHNPSPKEFSTSIGLNFITQGNVYNGTDYFSVIPNFRNYGAGAFVIEKWTKDNLTIEGGIRYDWLWLQVYMYNVNLQYINPIHQYSNITTSLGATYKFTDNLSLNLNYGSAWRAPGPNELYGEGVHVSAASFEKGDTTLKVEQAYNFSGSVRYQDEKLNIELGLYSNIINHYIYLRPDLQPVILISGAYPSFTYTQANVIFKGIDFDLNYDFTKSLSFNSKTTIVRAFNYSINNYLINVPPDRFQNTLKYKFLPFGKFSQFYVQFSDLFVLHQWRVPPKSDYVAPPAAYMLLNAEIGANISTRKGQIEISLSANNITNVSYREYLDRLRYFSDEIGRNFILRLKIPLF
jgi:iron complex outermembrane receptor protein